MHHYTYITWNDYKLYIGVRSCKCLPKEDLYTGSHTDKTYIPTHKSIIKVWPTRELALAHEIELHNWYEVGANPVFANRAKQTSTRFSLLGTVFSDEHRRKLSEAHSGKTLSAEHKKKLSESHKGRVVTLETRIRIGKIRKGARLSEEVKEKIRAKHLGKSRGPLTEEHKQKIRSALKGRIVPEDQREKSKLSLIGRSLSESHKQKIKAGLRKYIKSFWWKHAQHGYFFGSVPELAEQFSLNKDSSALRSVARGGRNKSYLGWSILSYE